MSVFFCFRTTCYCCRTFHCQIINHFVIKLFSKRKKVAPIVATFADLRYLSIAFPPSQVRAFRQTRIARKDSV